MTLRRRAGLYFRFRSPEQLELRDMLSGHGLTAAFPHFGAAAAQMANYQSVAAAMMAQISARSHVFAELGTLSTSSDHTKLTATLTDPNGSGTGTATFKTGTYDGVTETVLKVSVTGATASSTLDIKVGDTTVGTLSTDSTGAGSVVLSTDPKGTQQAFTTVPTGVTAGTLVTVDTLSGSLATATRGEGHGGCHLEQESSFTAALADPNGSGTGTATLTTSTHNGVTETKMKVSVTGAAASSTLDILVGGTKVGTLATDSTGAGSVVLSTDPSGTEQAFTTVPTSLAAGTTVAVDTLSGTLAASTNGEGDDDGGGCHTAQHSSFTAALTDSDSSATGTAKVTSSTKHGVTTTTFTLSVTGAPVSQLIDVLIGTTNVGQISTDSTGAGTLTVTTGLPTVSAGTTVTVGTLNGTFAASTSSSVASSAFRFGRHRW